MLIRMRLFARQREIAGTRVVELDLPEPATVEDAWVALTDRVPALAPSRRYLRFARNGDYADGATAVEDGDEVVCIPPVSGGAAEDAFEAVELLLPGGGLVGLAPAPLSAALGSSLVARLATAEDGAVVVFEGRTRVTPGTPAPGEEAEAARHAGRRVEALEYEAYEPLALRVLAEICGEARERFGVERLGIVHAVGSVALGEISVVIVASAPHREAAFEAAQFAMDETKARAPIFKAERFADGVVWIGTTARTGPAAGHGFPAEGSRVPPDGSRVPADSGGNE